MKTFGIALSILCVLAAPAIASPQSDAATARKIGLLGTWAQNCDAPSGPNNPYETYSIAPDGQLTRTLTMGVAGLNGDSKLSDVVADSDGTFRSRWLRLSDRSVSFVVSRIDRRGNRSWRSAGDDGHVYVENGQFTESHTDTPTFHKCND